MSVNKFIDFFIEVPKEFGYNICNGNKKYGNKK